MWYHEIMIYDYKENSLCITNTIIKSYVTNVIRSPKTEDLSGLKFAFIDVLCLERKSLFYE